MFSGIKSFIKSVVLAVTMMSDGIVSSYLAMPLTHRIVLVVLLGLLVINISFEILYAAAKSQADMGGYFSFMGFVSLILAIFVLNGHK